MPNSPIGESKKSVILKTFYAVVIFIMSWSLKKAGTFIKLCDKKSCDRDTLCTLSCARIDKLWAWVYNTGNCCYREHEILCRAKEIMSGAQNITCVMSFKRNDN